MQETCFLKDKTQTNSDTNETNSVAVEKTNSNATETTTTKILQRITKTKWCKIVYKKRDASNATCFLKDKTQTSAILMKQIFSSGKAEY
jgi:hypothetical protein